MAKRFKTKRKISWKKLLSAVAVIAIILGSIAGIRACTKDETKTISASAFSRGGLDENGEYVETDKSIYTKEAFACIGLRVQPDFEASASYDVYYYDYDERLLDVRLGLTGVYDEDYPLAKYARIVIHPEIPADVDQEDFKIAFYEVHSLAKDFKITVNKSQKYLYSNSVNLFNEENIEMGKTFDVHGNDVYVTYVENEHLKTSGEIAVTGEYEYYDVYIRRPSQSDIFAVSVIAADEDDKVLVRQSYDLTDLAAGEWCKMTLEVPDSEADMYLVARMPKDAECYIFGYSD